MKTVQNTVLFLLISIAFACQNHHHVQSHEPTIVNNNFNNRNLQQSAPRSMVITFDFTQFNQLDLTNPVNVLFKEKCEQAVKIASKFFSDLIQIVPRPLEQRRWDLPQKICGGGNFLAKIPESDRTTDRDTDLHLYITYSSNLGEGYVAYAAACREIKGVGPTHGQVTFNHERLIKYRNLNNPIDFQQVVEVLQHEIIHVLGFNANSMKNWVNKDGQAHKNYKSKIKIHDGVLTTFLATPNVLEFSRKYFNCDTVAGTPLENQGDGGNVDSHWENTTILNELMRPLVSNTQAILSGFTAALLRDTGFYKSINENLIEESFYGKGEGCEFLTGKCKEDTREYCKKGEESTCDYYHYGVADCDDNQFYDKGCRYRRVGDRQKCFDKDNTKASALYTSFYGQSFNTSSKCFVSSLNSKMVGDKNAKLQPNCYQYKCNGNNSITIILGGKTPSQALCTRNNEQVSAVGYEGMLQCPDKIEEFCKYNSICPDFCSQNGYCNKGKCQCLKGFSGENCANK